MKEEKEMINLIMLGRTNYGKSTLCGRLCVDLGCITKEDFIRIKKHSEALDKKGMEFAFVMDESLEERQRGITMQLGFLGIEIKNKRINLMDPPGHIEFINNLISGVAGADAAVLIIDAQEFDRSGIDPQIEEHLRISRVFGINQLIILINKMDLLGYSEIKYSKVKEKVVKVLKEAGYANSESFDYIPISAFYGDNVIEKSKNMEWYGGGTFVNRIEKFKEPERFTSGPLRIPILRVFSMPETGLIIAGRIENGNIKIGDEVGVSPCFANIKVKAKVASIEWQHKKVDYAKHGMDVGIAFKEQSQTFNRRQIKKGYIVTNPENELKAVKEFKAKVIVLNHPTEIKNGYMPLLYCHQARIPCKIKKIESKINTETGKETEKNPKSIKRNEEAIVVIEPLKPLVAETAKMIPKLGRFVLRDANKTVVAGEILELKS
jgi:elongation factor 1-alpha